MGEINKKLSLLTVEDGNVFTTIPENHYITNEEQKYISTIEAFLIRHIYADSSLGL